MIKIQQLLWQIQNENKIHTVKFPKGWFVICLDNPDDEEYSMNIIEDAAGLRRSTHIYCDVNYKAFITYAKYMGFHEIVTGFIETNPKMLYDFESQKLGRVFANPASWERVSNILWGYEHGAGILKNLNDIEIVVSGLLNSSVTRMFIDFIRNNKNDVKPEDIFKDYSNKVKSKIIKLTKESNNPKLGQIMNSFMNYLTSKPKYERKELNNISEFLSDMPNDISSMFFTNAEQTKKSNFEAYIYISQMISCLVEIPAFANFFKTMQELGQKARSEK